MTCSDHEKLSPARRVTLAITAMLERGVRPWTKPWDASVTSVPMLPRRANGAPYRGINAIALWSAAADAGYTSPFWFTFRQALALGAAVRRGERGRFIVFYKELASDGENAPADADDRPQPRRVLRGYVVFNRIQIDGLGEAFDAPGATASYDSDAFAERFARVPARVRHGGARAYYAMATDHVQLPPLQAFRDVTQYYATLAHELGHWTRHPSRLNRDFGHTKFGDPGYALEELVAELCSAFVGAVIGLPADHLEDHAGYIAGWLEVLKDNPNAFLTAAARAQSAADYLLRHMGEHDASEASDG